MATAIETVRLLSGDLDGDTISDAQILDLIGSVAYSDAAGARKVNIALAAAEYCSVLGSYRPGLDPVRSDRLIERADELRALAQRQVDIFTIAVHAEGTVDPVEIGGVAGLTETQVRALINAHAALSHAHHNLPDLSSYATNEALQSGDQTNTQELTDHNNSNTPHTVIRQRIDAVEQQVPSNQDIQDYVDSGIQQHTGMANAHHTPPESTGDGDSGNGFLALDSDGQLVTPSADTVGRASIFAHQIYIGTRNPGNPGANAAWDWDAMTSAQLRDGTGTNNAVWRGTHSTEDAIGSPADGHYAYITNRHRLRRYEGFWEDASSIRMQGSFTSQADAEAHITTVNSWAWWPGPQGLQFLASYTAPTTAIADTYSWVATGYTEAEWLTLFGQATIQNLSNVPEPQARSFLRWNEAGTAIENASSPADEAIGNAKGPVWATSPVLTTGVTYTNNNEIPFPGTEHWNLSSDAPGGVAHGTGSTRGQLAMPATAPTGVLGVWVQALIDGVIEDEALLVYGHGNAFHSQLGASDIHLRLDDGGTFFLQVRWQRADYIALYGADTTIPSNVTVQIRPVIIRGERGEAGDATAEVETHEADAAAHSSVILTHNTGLNSHQDIRGVVTQHEGNLNAHTNAFATRFNTHNASSSAHSTIRQNVSNEIDGDIGAHNTDAGAHPGLATGGDVAAHNAAGDAHSAVIAEDILEHDDSQLAHSSIRNLITDRVEIRDWEHNTTYFIGQIVIDGPHFYLCIVSHESGGTRTGTRGAPPSNPNDWRALTLGGGLHQIGSGYSGAFTQNNRYKATGITPTGVNPTPRWLHIRPGLVQSGHGLHGEFVRISYSEWAGLTNGNAAGSVSDSNALVLGNFGATSGVEIYIGRTSSGEALVASSHGSQFAVANFQIWSEL